MHLLVVRLNDSAIDLCCMRNLLHAFISGSVELFSNIGRANDRLCKIGGAVNRTVNSARLANRSTDCQIVEIGVSVRTYTTVESLVSRAYMSTPVDNPPRGGSPTML